jgi:hypothetical protein
MRVSVTTDRQQTVSMVTARLYNEPYREERFIRKKIQKFRFSCGVLTSGERKLKK